ncbi:MurR/RpiR family transcriptional regulator [Romboutsia weinsteinii]|uniref:MurR/RpiR family transcriptional regulator n=1 Tax=Romboutsia weinsteinii TaxID=2020949 RepID=A0A371J3E5_9FIRM|nr:MurR/RpiR family transcriptional regulator [Romboutsia weinsteinii]RDY27302.1 MurR/RpiR family transcriptional regulator [Romboutsia weinsteinii]
MELEKLINTHFELLTENDLFIWKYIKNNIEKCCELSCEELAKECSVSRATILRFSRKISLSSFADLKLYIKMYHQSIESQDSKSLDYICENYHKLIDKFKKKDFYSVCEKIQKAERIFIFGTGNAQKAEANELKRVFLTVGKCFYELFDIGELMLISDTFTDKDLMFIISLSGETESALEIAKHLKCSNVPTISLTRLKNNSLARICDENLYVGTTFMQGANNLNYETTTLFFILIEILFIKYMDYVRGSTI